jgi:hypothetical protein
MAKTSKGHIQQLPSGSFRVKVYAGTDPVTGKERLLRQTCPDEASAHAALGRMLVEADGGRFPTGMRLSASASCRAAARRRPDRRVVLLVRLLLGHVAYLRRVS